MITMIDKMNMIATVTDCYNCWHKDELQLMISECKKSRNNTVETGGFKFKLTKKLLKITPDVSFRFKRSDVE